jgi:hypothetical protein
LVTVSRLAAKTDAQFNEEAYTRTFVEQKIADYALMLEQADEGLHKVTRPALEGHLNRWLDELAALVGGLPWTPETVKEIELMTTGGRYEFRAE